MHSKQEVSKMYTLRGAHVSLFVSMFPLRNHSRDFNGFSIGCFLHRFQYKP